MTLSQAKQLYIGAGGPSDHSDSEWQDIHKEMKAIVDAKSDRTAGKTILWWDCWDKKYTATAFARRVRQSHANSLNQTPRP
jgi:hypothetical protein